MLQQQPIAFREMSIVVQTNPPSPGERYSLLSYHIIYIVTYRTVAPKVSSCISLSLPMATAGAPGHFVARFGDSESAKCSISAVPSTSSRQSLQFFHHVSNSVSTSPFSTKKTKKENHAMYVYDIFTHSFETYIFVAEISAVFTVHEWLPRGLPSPCRNY